MVKGDPISNDVLLEDAEEAGIDKVAEILTTGQAEAGIALQERPLLFRNCGKKQI